MIKLKMGGKSGKALYMIGFTKENLALLIDGIPITFNMSEMEGPDAQLVVWAGETEQTLVNMIQQHGLITEKDRDLMLAAIARGEMSGSTEEIRVHGGDDQTSQDG